MYKHPGVYIEHVPSGLLAIEAASTAVAAFIGPVGRGELVTADEADGKPAYVSSVDQYAKQFGPLGGGVGGLRNMGGAPDSFGWAVQSFFLNGGSKAYIVPIGVNDGDSASAVIGDPADNALGFNFTAMSDGAWANGMVVRMSLSVPDADPLLATYDVAIGLLNDSGVLDPVLETHTDMVVDPASGQFLASKINNASELVRVEHGPRGSFSGSAVVGTEGTPDAAFDPSNLTAASTLELDFAGDTVTGNPITVTFDGGEMTLADVAARIQDQGRGTSTATARSGLKAEVTHSGAIRILPGASTNAAVVNVLTVTGGSTQADLGFDTPGVVGAPPVVSGAAEEVDARMIGGTDPGAPSNADYTAALQHLRDYRDITMLMLPGKAWAPGGDNGALEAAIAHCEFMQNRMVLIDPPEPVGTARLRSPVDVKNMGAPTSPYAALYYPWLEVANPFYNADTAANLPKTFRIPPGSFAAGLWSRIDSRRGVWKAPAGLEATVRGALAPNIDIGADLQDNLNEFGVNCLRSILSPVVIWGARTRATKTKPEYRYIPVRRTQNMIGESLYGALQAVVFEPNDHKLWASLRASANAFMDTLHRAGAFQGEKASDAYYVRCGLGSTMTQADIDAGVVRLVVGFAPLKPAEFVVVQIKQIVGQNA